MVHGSLLDSAEPESNNLRSDLKGLVHYTTRHHGVCPCQTKTYEVRSLYLPHVASVKRGRYERVEENPADKKRKKRRD